MWVVTDSSASEVFISRLNVSETILLFALEITGPYTGITVRNSMFCILSKVSTWSLLTLTPVKKIMMEVK